MRLFLAVELPERVRAGVSAGGTWTAAYDIPQASFVRPENLHLTLKFLEEYPDSKLSGLVSAINRRVLPLPLTLGLRHVRCLPKRGPVRILAAGVTGNIDQLHVLHREIESACEELEVPPEEREFFPHVTIARLRPPLRHHDRRGIESAPLAASATELFTVEDVVLFQSHLGPGGPQYVPLARFGRGHQE